MKSSLEVFEAVCGDRASATLVGGDGAVGDGAAGSAPPTSGHPGRALSDDRPSMTRSEEISRI